MARVLALFIVVGVVCCVVAAPVAADRLILIPEGTTLSTGGISAEYATSPEEHDATVYWLNLGVSRVEVEGASFKDFGVGDVDAVSAQIAVLPETSFTPAIALGVRDISDETEHKGALYDGRAIYLAVSMSVPLAEGIPGFIRDVKLHGGIGTGSLGGVFFGAQGRLPMGLELAGEYDTEYFNFAVSYKVLPGLKVRGSSMKGDLYYGALFSTSF